jgi:hypothetical protein
VSDHHSVEEDIRRYAINNWDFFHHGHPVGLVSPLFDVPLRLVCGAYCYYEHLPGILREVTATASPAEIGRRMKEVAQRPNLLNLSILMLGYFNGREQVRLRRGLAPDEMLDGERREDVETVVGFWRDVSRAYIELDDYLPIENDYRLPTLTAPRVAELVRQLTPPTTGPDGTRRLMATAELYTYILNGESRIGVFHHGPYPLEGGDTLLVKELVNLRADYLPWRLTTRPPVDALARVMRVSDVQCRIDLFGSLAPTPLEYEDRIVSELVLVRQGGELRPLGHEDRAPLLQATADGPLEMYEQAAGWSPEYQIAYGADLYASQLLAFSRLIGMDIDERVRSAFKATAARVVPGLLSGEDAPLILARIEAAEEGDLYSLALPDR